MIISIQTFQQACEMAAFKDDGEISKAEKRTLKRIRAAASAFKAELEKI